ncbi:MAG: hypothetical protein ACPG5Z_15560 [Pseudoalteromonas sp.]
MNDANEEISKLSDFDVKLKISELLYDTRVVASQDHKGRPFDRYEAFIDNRWQLLKDYCNNWNDLMPLVAEYKISLGWDSFNWTAFQAEFYDDGEFFGSGHETTLINPKRALAECLYKALLNIKQ